MGAGVQNRWSDWRWARPVLTIQTDGGATVYRDEHQYIHIYVYIYHIYIYTYICYTSHTQMAPSGQYSN